MQSVLRSSKGNYTSVPPAFLSLWFGKEAERARHQAATALPCSPSLAGMTALPLICIVFQCRTMCEYCTAGSKEQSRMVGGSAPQARQAVRSRVIPSVGTGQGGARLAHRLHGAPLKLRNMSGIATQSRKPALQGIPRAGLLSKALQDLSARGA